MKKKIITKRVLKIIGIIIILLLIVIFSISYITDNNTQTLEKLTQKIQKHYKTTKINYSNTFNNYYIIKTNNQVIILTKDYKEVAKEDISKLKEESNNYDLIYKTNKIMYEKKTLKKNKIIYDYYDAITGEKIKTTTMEMK